VSFHCPEALAVVLASLPASFTLIFSPGAAQPKRLMPLSLCSTILLVKKEGSLISAFAQVHKHDNANKTTALIPC
jgi:hypothetical protein